MQGKRIVDEIISSNLKQILNTMKITLKIKTKHKSKQDNEIRIYRVHAL